MAPRGSWPARLALAYERRGLRTALAKAEHEGPLRVQKALYPEGDGVCQTMVIHPPAGIAGGDVLDLSVTAGPAAHVQLTTPEAGKWYRSDGRPARQSLRLCVADGAVVEWLPQETILFNGAEAEMQTTVELAAGGLYCGWEILCLGRTAAGESFAQGRLRLETRVEQQGRLLWIERGHLFGGSPWLTATAGLGGSSVSATLLFAGGHVDHGWLESCRALPVADGLRCGATLLPGVLVVRVLADGSEVAREWLAAVWRRLRPLACGRVAVVPRIWST